MQVLRLGLAGMLGGLALFCLTQGPASWAAGTGFSGLVGAELRPQSGGTVETVTELLLGGKGAIDKVVVSDDTERRLAVKVTYRKFPGRQIGAEVLTANGKPHPNAKCVPVKLPAADGEVELSIDLDPAAPADAASETLALRLSVTRPGRPVPDLVRVYPALKRWQAKLEPGNVIVKVTPDPVGVTASLRNTPPGETPVLVKPPTKVLMMERLPLAATSLGTVTPAPATGAATTRGPARGVRGTGLILAKPGVGTSAPAAPGPAGVATGVEAKLLLAAPLNAKLIAVQDFGFGVPTAVKDLGGQGPADMPIAWLTSINSVIDLTQARISRLWPDIYQDQNPDSGIYYYMPRAYRLQWSADEGFGMKMLYLAAPTEGQAGQVMMTARLASGADTVETDIARELLKGALAKTGAKFTDLRPLPISQAPAISLSDALKSQFNIPADKISVNGISDALGEVSVSWVTDTVTKENVQLSLTSDVGINGTATLTPAGGSLAARTVEVAIALADPDTLGWFRWKRDENWRNLTPYPVRMKYLCALLVPADTKTPIIYAWDLHDANVPPQAQLELDVTRIPAWLDARAMRMWFVYSVPGDRDRELYDKQVVADITGGVSSLGAYNLTFKTLTPLADTHAAEISVQVRSKYFDPRVRDLQVKPALPLDEDRKEYTLGPIYLVNRQPGEQKPGDPLFEYQLTVIMGDGTELRGANWVPVNNLRVLIGSKQVTDAVGPLPGATAPAAAPATPDAGTPDPEADGGAPVTPAPEGDG